MNKGLSIKILILTILLPGVSATVDIRHYCDYLGSTRAVVDTAGVLLQAINYYPSGVPFSRIEQEMVTDKMHTGKPFIDTNGLGYYDNNARFLDILTGGFISRDALSGDYPHLSPYAHCANNPLIYIDPTGNRVIYEDDITAEQRRATMECILSLSAGGMFQNMYTALENVGDVITIRYGETVKDAHGNNVPGQFAPNKNGKGGTITFNKEMSLTSAILAEELYHSYQNITPNEQDVNTNFEYEAKVFTIGACYDAGRPLAQFKGLELFELNVLNNKYGSEIVTYTTEKIETLTNDYIKYGNNFVDFHISNKSNNHYLTPITIIPQRLLNLIQ